MTTTKNKTSSLWNYIVLKDDNGNEIQRFELNEKQKLNVFKARDKKRNLKNKTKKVISISIKNMESTPKISLDFSFQSQTIFSRNKSILLENQTITDNLSVEHKIETKPESLDDDDDLIFGSNYIQSIDYNLEDSDSLYFTGIDDYDVFYF